MTNLHPGRLGDILGFFNGKAVKPDGIGKYPVYGSNGLIGRSDTALYEDAIVIGRVGAYCGAIHYCHSPFWASDNTIVAKPKSASTPIRFLAYLLENADLNRYAGGAAQPLLTHSTLKQVPVELPTPLAQEKIAHVLAAFDDLIDINSRRITHLDAIAQLLYEEWFVRFRFPGRTGAAKHAAGGVSLPRGWSTATFAEALAFHIGGGWGLADPDPKHDAGAYVIRGTDIPRIRYGDVSSCPRRFHSASNAAPRTLQDGDIVLEVSGGSKGQPVGRAALIDTALLSGFGDRAICASFCKLLRPQISKVSPYIVYLHLRHIYETGAINKYQVQSTGITNFKFAQFLAQERLVIPEPRTGALFAERVAPLFRLAHTLGGTSMKLREMRKFLLPRLLAGEIDADKVEIKAPVVNGLAAFLAP